MTGKVYARRGVWKSGDFADSKDFEARVKKGLPTNAVDRTNSTDQLDFYVPGAWIEVKEKKQRLGQRWHLLPGVEEPDLFVLDELSLRKALKHGHEAWFLLRDVPGDRLFLAQAVHVACVERARVNRWTTENNAKGKLILDLREYAQISSPDVTWTVLTDPSLHLPDPLASECLGRDVPAA